ncbi:lipocalin family protein [Brumimicrobium mesophilum]|uniref:lipocalin family protein n=1 Tax=Brumimicrobium mesophilum TaxID=392717 RepID=UPI000D1430DC|nr:lipocalin family protein [Brumimicrobium mesophilum]
MQKLIFITFLLLYQIGFTQNKSEIELSFEEIQGKWYINMSNFPMWLKGDKVNPSLNYTIEKKDDSFILYDEVIFEKNGKTKSIVGYDYAENSENTHFIWRGKGILKILKSEWKIVETDPKMQWMIIYFEKTLFTPEGYDVVSRNKNLSLEDKEKIEEELKAIDPNLELKKIHQK